MAAPHQFPLSGTERLLRASKWRRTATREDTLLLQLRCSWRRAQTRSRLGDAARAIPHGGRGILRRQSQAQEQGIAAGSRLGGIAVLMELLPLWDEGKAPINPPFLVCKPPPPCREHLLRAKNRMRNSGACAYCTTFPLCGLEGKLPASNYWSVTPLPTSRSACREAEQQGMGDPLYFSSFTSHQAGPTKDGWKRQKTTTTRKRVARPPRDPPPAF